MTLLDKLVGDDKNCTWIYRFLANPGMSRGGVLPPSPVSESALSRVPALPYPLVGLSAPGLGVAALETLVLLGDGFAPETDGESGADDPRAPGQRPDVLRSSDHQGHEGGAQLEDSYN